MIAGIASDSAAIARRLQDVARTRITRKPSVFDLAAVVREAVEGMLPKNRLGRRLATKLKVYAGPDHPHRAQKPVPLA